jgi:hypothetical protein
LEGERDNELASSNDFNLDGLGAKRNPSAADPACPSRWDDDDGFPGVLKTEVEDLDPEACTRAWDFDGLANGSGNEGSGTLGPYGRLLRLPADDDDPAATPLVPDRDPETDVETEPFFPPAIAVGDKKGLDVSSCTGVEGFPRVVVMEDPRLNTGVLSKNGFD